MPTPKKLSNLMSILAMPVCALNIVPTEPTSTARPGDFITRVIHLTLRTLVYNSFLKMADLFAAGLSQSQITLWLS